MSGYGVFLRKELQEHIRTFKFYGVVLMAAVLGLMSPLLAKLTPQLLGSMSGELTIEIPDPTAIDAYGQFFSNVGQIAFLAILLIAAGVIASEMRKGTASLVLTKRLGRPAFVLAKYTAWAGTWTVSYALGAVLCLVYTMILFPDWAVPQAFVPLVGYWLYGLLLLAGAVFSSALFKNFSLSALGGVGIWGILGISSLLKFVKNATPQALVSRLGEFLAGAAGWKAFLLPACVCLVFIVALLWGAAFVLKKKEI